MHIGCKVRVKGTELDWIGIGILTYYVPGEVGVDVKFEVHGGVTLPFYIDELEEVVEDKIHISLCRPWKA